MNWQPISSAPKDPHVFWLAWDGEDNWAIVYFYDGEWRWNCDSCDASDSALITALPPPPLPDPPKDAP